MRHPDADTLLLLAYGELPPENAPAVEAHLAACAACHESFGRLERARVAAGWSLPARPRRSLPRLVGVGLAAAAVIAAVLITRTTPDADERRGWRPPAVWSATAGYIAGGAPVVEIDAQLTRLEQERPYGFPN